MQSMTELKDADVELQAEEKEMELAELEKAADEAPIVKLVNLVLTDAVKRGASDIHMEPYEKEFRVRFRIDGVLQSIMTPPLKLKDAITSRVKIMAKLDISEKRLPQDGRIMLKMKIGGKKKQLDFRVSTLPTLWGEKIVMRLLDKENLRLDMTKLGFEPESLVKFEKAILKPYGMVLVTGPRDPEKPTRSTLDCAPEPARYQHHDRRRPGRIPAGRRKPGADEGTDRLEFCGCAALLPAPGSQHHSGRRDPRLRNRRNCHQGGADRSPGAFHSAHQRRARNHHPSDEHGY